MSNTFNAAGKIAVALRASEKSLNQAAADLLMVGAQVCQARNTSGFHPLDGQRELERLGKAITGQFGVIGDVARVHDSLFAEAKQRFDITGTGNLCPWPAEGTEQSHAGNVVALGTAS